MSACPSFIDFAAEVLDRREREGCRRRIYHVVYHGCGANRWRLPARHGEDDETPRPPQANGLRWSLLIRLAVRVRLSDRHGQQQRNEWRIGRRWDDKPRRLPLGRSLGPEPVLGEPRNALLLRLRSRQRIQQLSDL
jgi:hypothetical protein